MLGQVNISDDKILGLKRTVEELSFVRDKESTQIILNLKVHYYKNDDGEYGEEVTDKLYQFNYKDTQIKTSTPLSLTTNMSP